MTEFLVGIIIALICNMAYMVGSYFFGSNEEHEDFELLNRYTPTACDYCGQHTCGCGATTNPWT